MNECQDQLSEQEAALRCEFLASFYSDLKKKKNNNYVAELFQGISYYCM